MRPFAWLGSGLGFRFLFKKELRLQGIDVVRVGFNLSFSDSALFGSRSGFRALACLRIRLGLNAIG